MLSLAGENVKIGRVIVPDVLVRMMDNLAGQERATELFLGYDPMLVPTVQLSVGLAGAPAALGVAAFGCRLTRNPRVVIRWQGCS
ncbi:hypothetical protein [Bradyrhizobium oropedii]|uniref:hypothetical protein n=1 Tax=Bradyrhizobium oropedii TaxID=1571201 RepID=UPI001E56C519|nr:hypothetical protein [Bradyrhizobium oropedii]